MSNGIEELGLFCQHCRCYCDGTRLTAENGAAYFCSLACIEAYERDLAEEEDESNG